MTNLQLRVISSIVLIAAVLVPTWFGGWSFRLLAALIAGLIFYEWTQMSRGGRAGRMSIFPESLMLLFAAALVAGLAASQLFVLGSVLFAIVAVLSVLRRAGAWEPAGFAYAALSGLSLAMLRGSDTAGLIAILFLFAAVWATDIFAYFVGRAVGGPKLAPSISPGKTRSGAVGGAVGGVVAALAVAWAAGLGNLGMLALVALFLSVVSQAGDLFESWVKRRHGVKDSGSIIPGHGGVMDRVDGLVAAALALYLIGCLLGSTDQPARGLFAI